MENRQSISDVFTECYTRASNACQDCGETSNLEIHHILPISQGGRNTLGNLKVVCQECHRENYKSAHYPKDKSKIIPFEEREKTRYGIDKSINTQVLVTLPIELLEKVEAHWHENKIKNRSEAIRILISRGLEKEPSE